LTKKLQKTCKYLANKMTTTEKPKQTVISYDKVYILLKKLHDDKELEISDFRNLALVNQCRQNNPLFTNSQAIRRVFFDVLDTLKQGTEKQEYYAFILKGRFWDEYSITKMIMSDRLNQMPQRTFSYEQKKAINAFCELLLANEQQCRNDHPEFVNPETEPSKGSVDMGNGSDTISSDSSEIENKHKNRNRVLLVIIAILAAVSLMLLFRLQNYKSREKSIPTAVAKEESSPSITTKPTSLPALCLEKGSSPVVVTDPQFMRSQGLIDFDNATNPGIINNKIRSLYPVQKGVWIGYFATDQNSASGVSFYDRENKRLLNCSQVGITDGQNVNDIVVDHAGVVWVGMEKGGIARFDGKVWRVYKTQDGLPSDWIYGLFVDEENYVWAATYKGVAKFDGNRWNTVFNVENGTLINDRTHIVTMDSARNIWIGYIENGVSVYHPSIGKWEHFSPKPDGLSGKSIRNIVVQKDNKSGEDIIWIATFDNGLSRYENGAWTAFTVKDGLPANELRDVTVDKYGRVWVATSKGVAYFSGDQWKIYDTLETNNVAFGINCEGKQGYCLDDENILTATNHLGLTHSRIPLPDDGLDVVKVCFVKEDKSEICPDLVKDKSINTVIANYPEPLKPGNKFFMKVTVSPLNPYKLLDSRGDQLINVDADTTRLYGTFPRIPVSGSVESGQDYTFIDFNNPYVVPAPEDEVSLTLTSTWRMWMQTRLIGPNIRISFTIKSAY
jgi:hypothetical protein